VAWGLQNSRMGFSAALPVSGGILAAHIRYAAVVAVCTLKRLRPAGASEMFRRCAYIAPAVVLVGLSSAQAVDTTLTLACQGTVTTAMKPDPISMGIIVNFTKQTVHGFGDSFFQEQLIKITGITETAVYFGASDKLDQTMQRSVIGTIDRVTGDVDATFTVTDSETGKNVTSTSYALKCKPTQRMF
jgi:hypothetical protein